MIIKLCGLKRAEDIEYINEALPDFAGFVFAKSQRYVTPEQANSLVSRLDKHIKSAGVFVNESLDIVEEIAKHIKLDVIQLHGGEDFAYISELKKRLPETEVWKAVRIKSENDIKEAGLLTVNRLLLDAFSKKAYGGTGEKADWALIAKLKKEINKPFLLAGGLDIKNIQDAVKTVMPHGVDISSGIEKNGFKDRDKILELVRLIRGIEA